MYIYVYTQNLQVEIFETSIRKSQKKSTVFFFRVNFIATSQESQERKPPKRNEGGDPLISLQSKAGYYPPRS